MNTYINVKQLQDQTGISYRSALEIINEIRKEMKEKGYLVPRGKTKIALTNLVYKRLGIKVNYERINK